MKRSPLNRRTPLTRKTEIKRVSDKTRKLIDEWAPVRKAFLGEMGVCSACEYSEATEGDVTYWTGPLECHEIVKGGSRVLGFQSRESWLAACPYHNREAFEDYSVWPPERQLALKLKSDPYYFDLDLLNKLRGRSANAITLADVAAYLTVV